MVTKYINLETGEVDLYLDKLSTGINIDVDGNAVHLSQIDTSYLYGDRRKYDWFNSLLSEGTMVGRDLSVTTTRTGTRKSIFTDESAEVAANTGDLHIVNGLYLYGAMNGATNAVDTDLTNWTEFGAGSSSVVDNGNGTYRITATGPRNVVYGLGSFSNSWSGFCQAKLISGSLSSSSYFSVNPGSDGDTLDTVGSDWTELQAGQGGANSDTLAFGVASGDSAVFDVRYVRCNNNWSDVKHPAFPDGSASGASYGDDRLSCTPSWPSAGTIIAGVISYGGDASDNPESASPRILSTTDTWRMVYSTNVLLQGSGGSPSLDTGEQYTEGVLSIGSIDWDGTTNMAGRWTDQYPRTTASEADVPNGTLYIGDGATGINIAHGAILSPIIFDRVLSDAEYEVLRAGIQSRLSGVTFR